MSVLAQHGGRKVTHIDKFLISLLLCSPSLIFEDNIVVPSTFHIERFRIQKRIAECNMLFSLFLLLGSLLRFLYKLR